MANTSILLKKSATPGGIPSSLEYGELALNYRDGKLYYKNYSDNIVEISGGAGGSSDSFATINSNSTLILATSTTDTLSFIPGDNIFISTDAIDKSITISAAQQFIGDASATGEISASILKSLQSIGDEGGEIQLSLANTNTTLNGSSVNIDVYQDKLRFFESGGSNRGYFLDMANAEIGSSTDILGTLSKVQVIFDQANTTLSNITNINGIDATQNTNITNVGNYANSAFSSANAAQTIGTDAQIHSNYAYYQANVAYEIASSSSQYANGAFQSANSAAIQAQGAYDSANTKLPLTGGTITGNLNIDGRANVNSQLQVGTGSYVILPNTISQFTGNTNLYSQVNQQNIDGHGTADFVVTANNGTDLINYLDMGIAGSQYDNTNYNSWNFVNPNDGFIMLQGNDGQDYGGNLYIGTTGSGQIVTGTEKADIVFIQGSNREEVARFVLKQGLVIKTNKESYNVSTGSLVINGGAGINGSLYARNIYDNGTRILDSVNTATAYATSAGQYANSAFDVANTAVTNTISLSFINDTQNTNINNITSWLSSNNSLNSGINETQNTNITNVGTYANGAFTAANTATAYATSAGQYANSAFLAANTATAYATSAGSYANSAYTKANSASSLAQSAYNTANNKVSKSGDTITGTLNVSNTGNVALVITGSATISSDLSVTGNLYIGGNTTQISANNLVIDDSIIYLANNNPANLNDIGIVGNFTNTNYQHTGLVRDHTDGKWKFFSNVTSEPSSTVTFDANTVYDVVKVGTIEASTANIANTNLLVYTQGAFNQANNVIAASSYANSAFAAANTSTGVNATQNTNITNVGTYANNGIAYATSAGQYANSAYNKANSVVQTAFVGHTANGTSLTPSSNNDTLTITATVSNGIFINANSTTKTIDLGLKTSGVTSGTYGGSTNIPVLTVDSFGRVTSASNTSVSTTINLSANSGTGSVAGGGTLSVIGNTGISTFSTGSNIYIRNTGVTSLTTASSSRIAISQTSGDITVDLASIAGLSAGTYTYPLLQVDSYGRITSISSQSVGGTWIRKTSNYTANVGDNIIADTRGGIFTITLPPTPVTGQSVIIADGGSWSANNLTVARNGSTIEGITDNVTMDISGIEVKFIYDGTTWHVYASVGPEELPTQTGNQNKILSTNGTTPSWIDYDGGIAMAIALG